MGVPIRCLLVLAGFLVSLPSVAIVIRDDVDVSKHVQFAKHLPRPVVLGRNEAGSAEAMGTWISDSWILTAAHAVGGLQPGDSIQDTQELTVAEVVQHPGWQSDHIDLALIRVAAPQSNVDVVPVCSEADESETVAIIGAGDFGDGGSGPVKPGDVMLAAENRIAHLDERFLLFEFDAPDSGALPLEGVSGPGDSGGPAYRLLDDGACLVAVSSGQDVEPAGGLEGRYGVIEFYARADVQRGWIETVAGKARKTLTRVKP